MTKEEIQAEADNYALYKSPIVCEKVASKAYMDGVLSDTARKHWEQKWINSSERLPTKKDANEHGKILGKMFKAVMLVKYIDVVNHSALYDQWMPIPTFND